MPQRLWRSTILCMLLIPVIFNLAQAQPGFEANYDESKVPEYELPKILDSDPDSNEALRRTWKLRRAVILNQFAAQMYGTTPTDPFQVQCEQFESGDSLNGKARRQQFHITVTTQAGQHRWDLLVYTPKQAAQPVLCFLGLSFYGNHTISDDPEISITQAWCRASDEKGVHDHRATEAGRGTSKARWPVEMIINAGFGVATAYCGDIDPDFDDGFQNGIHSIFPNHVPSSAHPDRWGTISAWSWGLSRMLDCLQTDIEAIDGNRVIVIGHSRLGKTALWSGARDTRFAAAISNDSGCGGAALSRRAIGETVGKINHSFPHWFCPNFTKYNLNEASLPIDQHQLVALVAPRPVYVASASDDRWADPRGEFLATKIGGSLYEHFGLKGLGLNDFPEPDTASVGTVSYHLRRGKHDINAWDWKHYLQFAQQLEN